MSDYTSKKPPHKIYTVVKDGDLGFREWRTKTYASAAQAAKTARMLASRNRLYTVMIADVGWDRDDYKLEELCADAGITNIQKAGTW